MFVVTERIACHGYERAGGTKEELKILQGVRGGSGEEVAGATRTATESYNRTEPCLKSSIAGS
jgi:hypothetical protein